MRRPTFILVLAVLCSALEVSAQPVVFDVGTNYLNDTLYVGRPAEIRLNVDAGPYEVMNICWSVSWRTTNGLSVPLLDFDNLVYSTYANSTFAAKPWTNPNGDPDTAIIAGISFGGPWTGSHLFASILVTPQDTGTIFVDSVTTQPDNHVSALDDLSAYLPLEWLPGPIVVVPCTHLVGDLNGSGNITLADIILLVNYVFKMGPPPAPLVSIGNVDCMGAITSSDIIFLVNHQGKGGPPPPCPCANP